MIYFKFIILFTLLVLIPCHGRRSTRRPWPGYTDCPPWDPYCRESTDWPCRPGSYNCPYPTECPPWDQDCGGYGPVTPCPPWNPGCITTPRPIPDPDILRVFTRTNLNGKTESFIMSDGDHTLCKIWRTVKSIKSIHTNYNCIRLYPFDRCGRAHDKNISDYTFTDSVYLKFKFEINGKILNRALSYSGCKITPTYTIKTFDQISTMDNEKEDDENNKNLETTYDFHSYRNYGGHKKRIIVGHYTPCIVYRGPRKWFESLNAVYSNNGPQCINVYPNYECLEGTPYAIYKYEGPYHRSFDFGITREYRAYSYSGCAYGDSKVAGEIPKEEHKEPTNNMTKGLKNLNLFNGETIAVNIN